MARVIPLSHHHIPRKSLNSRSDFFLPAIRNTWISQHGDRKKWTTGKLDDRKNGRPEKWTTGKMDDRKTGRPEKKVVHYRGTGFRKATPAIIFVGADLLFRSARNT
jgi:hypothetical protein